MSSDGSMKNPAATGLKKGEIDAVRGGFRCPVPTCTFRDFIQPFVDDHVRKEHPERENSG